ncbi:MAG: sulfotransferase [Parvibaculaceae bacterium]
MVTPPGFDVAAEFQAAIQDWKAGRLAQAEQRYHRVLNAAPRHAHAHHNLGLLRLGQGLPGAALPYLLHATALEPDLAEAHNTLANAYSALGLDQDAEAGYRKALALKPGFAPAWFNLAALLERHKKRKEAKAAYREAIAHNPAHRDAHINLGNMLRVDRQVDEAIALMKRAAEIDSQSALAHNNLGNLYRDKDMLAEAEASYRRATEVDPAYDVATLNLGTLYAHLGRIADAAAMLRRTIGLAPTRGEPYFQLAHTTRIAPDDPLVSVMRGHYDNPATADGERMFFAFALGRIYDAAGRYDEAFACWQTANRLRRAQLKFDITAEKTRHEGIKRRFSAEFLATAQPSAFADETPIFIVGMIRSGTTLTEQILASHPDIAGADEMMWFRETIEAMKGRAPEDFAEAGRDYVAKLRERFGTGPRFIVDKMLGNYLHVGEIHLALPGARIIRVVRNPYDSMLSAYSSYFAEYHEYIYDMAELADYYALYMDLMDHWDRVLPGRIYHQRYESLVADPEGEVRRLLDFCGLPFNERCLAFHENDRRVRTASAQQVREKMNSRSVGRWRNYERHLQEWKARFGELS